MTVNAIPVMRKLPLIVFCATVMCSLCLGIHSYRRTERLIAADVNQALVTTLGLMRSDVVSADTIRCYRSHLTIAALRDTACIALRTTRRKDRVVTEMVADANCGFATTYALSDQRASATLLALGLLWLMASSWYMRRGRHAPVAAGLTYGGLTLADDHFVSAAHTPVRLTPMQHRLLVLFMQAEGHTLTKQDICNHLWPKKPDASDTLYTLIRRLKPVIEANSRLRITCDRGRSYSLTLR